MTQLPVEKTRILHFTLGPVQGFVAAARRTRDLWAGSFLLSWLAGHAMAAVQQAGGSIILPDVDKNPLMAGISAPPGISPAIGSLPNRFKALVPADFDPRACRTAIDAAWQTLADQVWTRFVEPVASRGYQTQTIWDRQVASFWDAAWVVGDDPADGSDRAWLDRRKNWRTYRPPVEGGDHCTLMGDWQELSGFVRARERDAQDAFWAELRQRVMDQTGNAFDLDEQGRERLCAIALIKRFFLEVAENAIGWTPLWDGRDTVRWPSTKELAEPSEGFYALLLMDGDSVGTLLSEYPENKVAAALAEFAAGVGAVVQAAKGYLVYAGGDDLLALLPLERALTAAINLRRAYGDAFQAQDITATTSAALIFAHFHVPLRQVLSEAHRQLEEVAKDGNGRSSIAVCVLSQSGVLRQWVSAWSPQETPKPPPDLLNECAAKLAGTIPGRFFYKVRETWGDVLALRQAGRTEGFSEDEVHRILLAEYLQGQANAAVKENAETLTADILTLARSWPGPKSQKPVPAGLNFDGPLLARFLGQKLSGGAE